MHPAAAQASAVLERLLRVTWRSRLRRVPGLHRVCGEDSTGRLSRDHHAICTHGGVQILTPQGVCHRELNLESALLHRRDARSALQIKVCEFGLSRVRTSIPP